MRSVFLIFGALIFVTQSRAENLCEVAQAMGPSKVESASLVVGNDLKPVQQDPKMWVLQWHDEFDKPGRLDPKLWKFEIGGTGWGNREAQFYTDHLENARVEDGKLVIEARKEEFANKQYTSARINSVNKVTYGKIEFRAKLPHGAGTWGAAWLLAAKQVHGTWFWPDNGELDVIEAVGNENNLNHYSTHSKNNNFGLGTQYTYVDPVYDGDTEFHVYSIEWLPESVTFLRDGVVKFHLEKEQGDDWHRWPFDQDMVIIMNLALGGGWGNDLRYLDDSMFPTRMEYDYVRVYRPAYENPGCTTILPDVTR